MTRPSPLPSSGGSYVRNKSGKLTKQKPPAAPKPTETPAPDAGENTSSNED